MLKTTAITLSPKSLITIIIAFCLYILLGLYSIHWLADTTDYNAGYDFNLYFNALTNAGGGQNPYLPDETSKSLLYHPFALVFLSIFSWLGVNGALSLWTVLSIVAWIATVFLLIKLTKPKNGQLNNRWFIWVVFGIFLTFAPFWETLYMGQINAFVALSLVLTLYYSENKHPNLAGIFLGLAIVLKLSPIIMLAYFFLMRQYRVIAVSLITLVILTTVAAFQFGWAIVGDFLTILPVLGAEIRPTKHNQSILSLSYRFLGLLTDINMKNALIQFHKALFAGILGVLLLMGFNNVLWTKQARMWLFGTLVTFITISSPLVWYHHSIFLVIPLLFMVRYQPHYLMGISLLTIGLIQGNRLFELYVGRYAVLALLAHFILMGVIATTYIKAIQPRKKIFWVWLAAGLFSLVLLIGITLRDDEGVLLTQTIQQAASPTQPVSADFGMATLEGYRVDLTRLSVRSEILLTTFWKPTSSFAEVSSQLPAKVFVHLRNDDNENVVQADHVLFGEAGEPQPFTGYIAIIQVWDSAKEGNEQLPDKTTISIPDNLPANTYQLYTGLYNPDTLERYRIFNDTDDENTILLGSVEIKTR